jgi:hypothetical protein
VSRSSGPAERPAFYALGSGGWRDYVTLLHPPYTGWHLAYVAIGAAAAPRFDGGRLGASVLAFFLAVGLSAHALDELSGRPLRTRIPGRVLQAIAAFGLIGAAAIGVLGAAVVSWWLLAFVAFGAFIVPAYNLELLGGRLHDDLWFSISWGAFPALTGYFAQDGSLGWAILPIALGCLLLSSAQRRLSTPVRELRRRVARVEGRIVLLDGTERAVDSSVIRAAPEAALRAMAFGVMALAAGLVVSRLS